MRTHAVSVSLLALFHTFLAPSSGGPVPAPPAINAPLRNYSAPSSPNSFSFITGVAFNPATGNEIAGASADTTITFWDKRTGSQLRQFATNTELQQIAYNPRNASELVTSSARPNAVSLWDAQSGQLVRTYSGHSQEVMDVAFNPLNDSEILSASLDGSIILWHKQTGAVIRNISGLVVSYAIAFSQSTNGMFLACCFDGVRLYNSAGAVVKTFAVPGQVPVAVAFNPMNANEFVAATTDNTTRLWDVPSGNQIRAFVAHTDAISTVAYYPADSTYFLSSSVDGTALLWNKDTGQIFRKYALSAFIATRAAFNPRNASEFVVGYGGNLVSLWSTTQLPALLPPQTPTTPEKKNMTAAIVIYVCGLAAVFAFTAFAIWKFGLLKANPAVAAPAGLQPIDSSEFHDLHTISKDNESRSRSGSGSNHSTSGTETESSSV